MNTHIHNDIVFLKKETLHLLQMADDREPSAHLESWKSSLDPASLLGMPPRRKFQLIGGNKTVEWCHHFAPPNDLSAGDASVKPGGGHTARHPPEGVWRQR